MDRIIVTHISFSKKRARVRKNTRARALPLIRNHKIPLERWTENSRESLSLSLSFSLSRAPFVRKRDDKHAQKERHKKSAGLRKRVHTRIQFYPPLSKREREIHFLLRRRRGRTRWRECVCAHPP